MSDKKTYDVGYKRPPQHTRFQPGQSGNPKGRAAGTLNLKHDLEQELSERIPIREGDRSLRVSKQRALLKAMLSKALKGDTRAASILLQLIAKILVPEAGVADIDAPVTDADIAILEDYVARRMNDRRNQENEITAEITAKDDDNDPVA